MCCTWRNQHQAGLFEISLNSCVRGQKNTLIVSRYQRKVFKKRLILGWILRRLQNSGFEGWGDLEQKIYGWTHGNLYFKMICCWKLFTGAKKAGELQRYQPDDGECTEKWVSEGCRWLGRYVPVALRPGRGASLEGRRCCARFLFTKKTVWLSNSTSLTFVKRKVCSIRKNNADIDKVGPFPSDRNSASFLMNSPREQFLTLCSAQSPGYQTTVISPRTQTQRW